VINPLVEERDIHRRDPRGRLAGRRVGELVSVLAATTPQPTSTLTYAAAPEAC